MDATADAVAALLEDVAGKTKTKAQGIVVARYDRTPEAVAGLQADAINHESRKRCRMQRVRRAANPGLCGDRGSYGACERLKWGGWWQEAEVRPAGAGSPYA